MSLKNFTHIGFLSAILLLTGCQQELYKSNNKYNIPEISTESPLVEFLIEPTDYDGILETENLAKTYDYAKIAHKTLWLNKFNENLKIAPTTRVVALNTTIGLNDIAVDSLLKFVSKGGTLFVTKATKDERMSFFYGLTPDADWSTNTTASGLAFNKPLLPGMQHSTFDNKILHRGLDVSNFSNNTNVLVSAFNDTSYPVLIENKIGNGKVVLFNSSKILEKEMRGLLFAATLIGLEGIPYPIASVATIFLEDFPSPVYTAAGAPITSSLNTDKYQFIESDWWPKMKTLATNKNIEYTTTLNFNSDTTNNTKISFDSWDKTTKKQGKTSDLKNKWLQSELINQGHEIAFRGYNNLPLAKQSRKNNDAQIHSLEASVKKWKESVSNDLPVSYSPPNNEIDSIGLINLKKGFPSLNYINTSFLGNIEQGGDREFDPDPMNARFFDYPSLSDGYAISADESWTIESTYLYTGIWTHKLDFNTIYENNTETNAVETFEKLLLDYKNRHPFTRFLSAKKATLATMDWRYQSIKHLMYEGKYEVASAINSDAKKTAFWLMYIANENNEKVSKHLNNEQMNFAKVPLLNGYLYHIKTNSPSLSVPDIRPEIKNLLNTTNRTTKKMLEAFKDFNNSKNKLVPLKEKIDRLVADEKPKEASNLMETLFKENKYLNDAQITTYAKTMILQGKEKDLWQQLNEIYLANPSEANANLSKKVSSLTTYPSKEIKKLWLERHMEWNTDDIGILKEYYTNFNTSENKKIIEQVLQTLVSVEPTIKNTKNYIDFLTLNNHSKLIPTLDSYLPCSFKDEEIAKTISYAYADKLKFDEAIQWSQCVKNFDQDMVQNWRAKTETIEDQKDIDFAYYIAYLLANNPQKALTELQIIEPCNPDLTDLSETIALLYGENSLYKKALAWSECSDAIAIKTMMDWNSETGNNSQLNKIYKQHMARNPTDYEVMNHMAQLQLLNGNLEQAGKIAMSIPEDKLEPDFKIGFNNEIKNQEEKSKTIYVNTFKVLMDDAIVKKEEIEKRKKKGHSIGFNSMAWADEFTPTLLNNRFQYGFYNQKGNFHRFSLSQAATYRVFKDTLIANDRARDLFGLEYKYSIESNEKQNSFVSTRIERDDTKKFYFHLNAGVNFIKENSTTSLEIDTHPVRTAPGYVLNIYDIGIKGEHTVSYNKNVQQRFVAEGNYYTDSQYYATGNSRIDYTLINLDAFKLGPLIEGAYSNGSDEQRDGFPYWLTEQRIVAGGGLHLQIGNPDSNFFFKTDASLFTEHERPNFQRYNGQLVLRVQEFTTINLNYNYFTIDNFFGNVFELGLQYNFK